MAEYLILLATMTGGQWIERLTEIVMAQPVAAAAVIGTFVLVGFLALRR